METEQQQQHLYYYAIDPFYVYCVDGGCSYSQSVAHQQKHLLKFYLIQKQQIKSLLKKLKIFTVLNLVGKVTISGLH